MSRWEAFDTFPPILRAALRNAHANKSSQQIYNWLQEGITVNQILATIAHDNKYLEYESARYYGDKSAPFVGKPAKPRPDMTTISLDDLDL